MNIQANNNIGELVAQDYRTAAVFQSHGIDFCCRGNRSIEEVCSKQQIPSDTLINELESVVTKNVMVNADYHQWPLDILAGHVEKIHHSYVAEKTPVIQQYLDKLCKVHGDRHPELFEITAHFNESATALAAHMKKEELILFPFIRKMADAERHGKKMSSARFGSVENPVAMMREEHEAEGERFRTISKLSDHYTPPEDACATYKVTFAMLAEFENDLHLHIHLENNILFPKAIAMQQKS